MARVFSVAMMGSPTLLVFALSVQAAEEPPAPVAPPSGTRALLPPVPQLRLRWPVAPQQFSFSASELSGSANGPLQLFQAESLWLSAGNLRLLTIGSVERANELDCRLTCQPVLANTANLEARFSLPKLTRALPSNYAFLRAGSFSPGPGRGSAGLIKTGIAGRFNF
ncbi:MAG TPA: hypothetical protein VEX18_08355 [Polyangiaceae bacterium]|nr:hypothetical protein [Polyangiaceae bacterium]